MKKIRYGLTIVVIILFAIIGNVQAYDSLFDNMGTIDRHSPGSLWNATYFGWSDPDYSGYYLGTFGGNDDAAALATLASDYLDAIFSGYLYTKVDEPNTTNGTLTLTYNADKKTGTWSLMSPYAVGFYAVKGGNEYALYFVDPYQSSGTFSTENLLNNGGNQPAVSHFSALAETQVPEPSILFLLGAGLIGIGAAVRRNTKR